MNRIVREEGWWYYAKPAEGGWRINTRVIKGGELGTFAEGWAVPVEPNTTFADNNTFIGYTIKCYVGRKAQTCTVRMSTFNRAGSRFKPRWDISVLTEARLDVATMTPVGGEELPFEVALVVHRALQHLAQFPPFTKRPRKR